MSKIRKAYNYVFYKLYKWYNKGPFIWASDWKAILSMDVILIFIWLSILVYYTIFIDRYVRFDSNLLFYCIYIFLIRLPNYLLLSYKQSWVNIVEEFDKLPKKRNRIGGWIVFGVVLIVFGNLIFSFYLMNEIDWSLYR